MRDFDNPRKKRVKREGSAIEAEPSSRGKVMQPALKPPLPKPSSKQLKFDKKLLSFVIDGLHPLGIVSTEKFRDLFSGVW